MIETKKFLRILLITILILFIPLIAMQFTDEVNWDLFDFIVVGIVLLIIGFLFESLRGNISKMKVIFYVLAILLGVSMLIFGGIDDSPGGQMLGLIIVVISTIGIFKARRSKLSSSSLYTQEK